MDESSASSGNNPAPPAPEAAPAPLPARTIGERLRAGRERSGLSIPAAAEKLHLDTKIIEALEADRFAEVGASVYVRGHLKRYADFVGEPGAELVSMYSTRESRVTAPDLTQVPQPERRADPRRLVTPLAVLGSSAVLLGAIWWVLAGSRPAGSAPTKAQVSPVVSGEARPVSAPAMATPASLTTTATAVPATAVPAAAAQASPAAATPVATIKEAPAREIRLRLELTNESWVEVYDSSGKQQFYDIASAGSVQSISGPGPLRVFLGNPAGVSVQVDGQSREIPSAAIDGEGARFVVNRSGSLSKSAR
jgi:cytoskeleton protein RodZ